MRKALPFDTVARIAHRALSNGGSRISLGLIEWDVSADCERPVRAQVRGMKLPLYADDKWLAYSDVGATSIEVDLWARCRKCPRCLRHRARLWSARARYEAGVAPKNWFGTLTIRPDVHQRCFFEACARLTKSAVDFDALSEVEQFRERDKEIAPELKLWLKRVRKSGSRFRYLLVAEAHVSGLPHYHVLIHQYSDGLSRRQLDASWKLGFSKFRLVTDGDNAAYLCKYLSKNAAARVRASQHYGKGWAEPVASVERDPPKVPTPPGLPLTTLR